MKHTVLIIEDNEINREILGDILSEDYNLLSAENGKVGMDLLTAHAESVDIVLLDIHMPVMNGYEVLKAVHDDPDLCEVPVIVTTSNDRDEDEEYCLSLGASDFIPKPYKPTIVRLRIENIIRLIESKRTIHYKTTFMQNISHEIKTPLTALYGYAQLLGQPEGYFTEEEREEFNKSIEDSYQMIELFLNDLFDTSQFDQGHFSVNITETDVNKVCHSAIQAVSYKKARNVNMYFTSDIPQGSSVHTDGKRAQQVLINFLTNACKNTSQGEIHLHCGYGSEGMIAFSVTDTGIGLPPEKAEVIFRRFAKLDQFKPGAGLGLYICRIIADKLGGRVYLDTSYRSGARFVFEIINR